MSDPFALWSERLLVDGALRPGGVVVRDEQIAAILRQRPDDLPVEDLGQAVLMPGLVDVHAHMNEPGRTEWEGFETATRAAIAGGITTVVDMPLNSDPVTTSLAALHAKIEASRGKLWADVGLWGGVVPGNQAELAPMVAAGVLGFKTFLCPSGIDEFPNTTAEDLRQSMPILRDCGVPLLAHAELEGPVDNPFESAPPSLYARYLHSRPAAWEDAAIALLIGLVRETGCRLHIVHLSSAGALPMLRAAKAEGLPISVETCPHYLCLKAEDVPDGATEYKCAPPIRDAANREALWGGLVDGTIDLIISDHSPCVPSLKLPETGDFLGAWGGIASLQLGLSSIWTECRGRGLGVGWLQRKMGAAPAALIGLGHQKGSLRVGAHADLVAWWPERSWTVTPGALLHRHKVSPYLGRELHGLPSDVWLRGARVKRDGALVGEARGALLGIRR